MWIIITQRAEGKNAKEFIIHAALVQIQIHGLDANYGNGRKEREMFQFLKKEKKEGPSTVLLVS